MFTRLLNYLRRVPTPRTVLTGLATPQFWTLIGALEAAGWRRTREYAAHDAWIDYGFLLLSRGHERIRCEWEPVDEGRIDAPTAALAEIRAVIDAAGPITDPAGRRAPE